MKLISLVSVIGISAFAGPVPVPSGGGGSGSGTPVTNIIDTTAIISGAYYTNNSGSNLLVSFSIAGTSVNSGVFVTTNGLGIPASDQIIIPTQTDGRYTFAVGLNDVYYHTNVGGATGTIQPASCQRVYSPAAQVMVPSVATIDASQITSGTVSRPITSGSASGTSQTNVTLVGGSFSGLGYYPEVLSFVGNAGITALKSISALQGMETELKSGGIWSNLVDCIPFAAPFNATNGQTFLGRTFTNRDFTCDSFGASGFRSPIKLNMGVAKTNLTLVVVWKYPTTASPLNDVTIGVFTTNRSGLVLDNQNLSYQRIVAITNGVQASSYLNDIVEYASSWNQFDYSYVWNMAQDRRVETVCVNTAAGKSSFLHNAFMGKVGFSSPVFTNTFQPVGALDYICIGGDGTSIFTNTLASIESAFVFDGYLSTASAQRAIMRATRKLNPAQNDFVIIGDSRSYPRNTNSIGYWLENNRSMSDSLVWNIGYSGTGANGWNGNKSFYTNMLFSLSGVADGFRYVSWNLGINDFANSNVTAVSMFQDTTNFLAALPSDYLVVMGTIFPTSPTNMAWNGNGVYGWSYQESNRNLFNNWVRTNSPNWYAIADFDYIISSNDMQNAALTTDGVHIYGAANSVNRNRELADFLSRSKQRMIWTTNNVGGWQTH